jgi:hypothetical protein
MQKGPSLTLRVMKSQAKRHPDRFKATNSATSKSVSEGLQSSSSLTLRVAFQQPASSVAELGFAGFRLFFGGAGAKVAGFQGECVAG